MKHILSRVDFIKEARESEDMKLYKRAKEAYYSGSPIIGDAEFDALEAKLGLANKGYIGTHHSKSYTVQHPFTMGSLSKIQIKNDKSGSPDFSSYIDELEKYFKDLPDSAIIEVTPKFDGCSWEAVFNDKGDLLSVSTRGDGEFGKDVKHWLDDKIEEINIEPFLQNGKNLVIRGEALIDFNRFNQVHKDNFTNTRSFVAGMFGQDWSESDEQTTNKKDISIIAYDFRLVKPGSKEYTWIDYNDIHNQPFGYNILTFKKSELNSETFADIYKKMEEVRANYKFPLDGFVLKPEIKYRKTENIARPTDCVAIKYLPNIVETEIIDIEWNVGKTQELFPKAIFKTIIMDGKKVNKASLHNYGFVIDNNVGIGSIVKISMAGDIIPFVYEIVKGGGDNKIPDAGVTVKGSHLMLDTDNEQKVLLRIKAGAEALNLRGFKDRTIEKVLPDIISNGFNINNILDLFQDDVLDFMTESIGGVNINKIVDEIKSRRSKLTLFEIVFGLQYENCGKIASKKAADYIQGLISKNDLTGVPNTIKSWLLDNNSTNRKEIDNYINLFNIKFEDKVDTSDKTPIIMTGSPKDFGYNTKSDFIKAHPEFIETTNWKECKILFTDDLNSTSGKMVKAQKLGIEIKNYF